MKKKQVVFDFDHTLVDDNTDTFVFEELRPALRAEMKERQREGMQWTDLMDHMMLRLFEEGVTLDDIRNSMRRIPFQEGMIDLVKDLAKGANLYIVSDSNTLFIETILEHHNLKSAFKRTETNFAIIEKGRIRVRHYHANKDCARCPVNMCKGRVLDLILEEGSSCAYVGDGGGDFCACLNVQTALRLARENFALEKKLKEANVEYVSWKNPADLRRAFEKHDFL